MVFTYQVEQTKDVSTKRGESPRPKRVVKQFSVVECLECGKTMNKEHTQVIH